MKNQHGISVNAIIGGINLRRKGQSVTAEITLCIEDVPDDTIMALLAMSKKAVQASITEEGVE